jgi:hypothetical protein
MWSGIIGFSKNKNRHYEVVSLLHRERILNSNEGGLFPLMENIVSRSLNLHFGAIFALIDEFLLRLYGDV